MIKYKVLYSYFGNSVDIYFKCKDKDVNEEYVTLSILEWTSNYWDTRRPVNLDNIISGFYRINIYADVSSEDVYFGSANAYNVCNYVNSSINKFNKLTYLSVFNLHKFINSCLENHNKEYNSFEYNFKFSLEFRNDNPINSVLNIFGSTLLYWDDHDLLQSIN